MQWWDPWDDDPREFAAGFTAGTRWAAAPANAAEARAIWEAQRGPSIAWPIAGRWHRRPWDAGFVLAVYGAVALTEYARTGPAGRWLAAGPQ